MNFTIVFPVTDLRRIYCPSVTYLERPSWLFPTVGKDFVRAFGGLKESESSGHKVDGLKETAIEPHLCEVRHGPKFVDLPTQVEDEGKFQWKVSARRLFFDQVASLRLEYDFEVNVVDQKSAIEPQKLISFIGNAMLQIKEHLGPWKSGFDTERFGNSGRILAKAFLERTVPRGGFVELDGLSDFVMAERPFVFMRVNESQDIRITDNFIGLKNPFSRYFDVYHDRDRVFSNHDVPIWLVVAGKKAPDRDLRNFCLYLRRCHADTEVAKRLLNMAFRQGQALPSGELFSFGAEHEDYVRMLLARIRVSGKQLRKAKRLAEKSDGSAADLSALASVSYLDTNPGLNNQFETGLLKMRFHHQKNRQEVRMFSDKLLRDAATTKTIIESLNMVDNSITNSPITNSNVTQAGGDVANNITQSFAAAGEAVTNDELKSTLKDLETAIQSALEAGDVLSPDELAEDVSSLTKEVASKKPRAARIAAIGGMIKDGILATSKLIPVVVTTVGKIKTMF